MAANIIKQRFNVDDQTKKSFNRIFSAKRTIYNYFLPFIKKNTEISHKVLEQMCSKLVETEQQFANIKDLEWVWKEALEEAHEHCRVCRRDGLSINTKDIIPRVDVLRIPKNQLRLDVEKQVIGIQGTKCDIKLARPISAKKVITDIKIDRKDGNKEQYIVISLADKGEETKDSFSVLDILNEVLYN